MSVAENYGYVNTGGTFITLADPSATSNVTVTTGINDKGQIVLSSPMTVVRSGRIVEDAETLAGLSVGAAAFAILLPEFAFFTIGSFGPYLGRGIPSQIW